MRSDHNDQFWGHCRAAQRYGVPASAGQLSVTPSSMNNFGTVAGLETLPAEAGTPYVLQ